MQSEWQWMNDNVSYHPTYVCLSCWTLSSGSWVQFFAAETGRKTSVNEALYSSEKTAIELFLFELWMQIPDDSDVQPWVSLNPTQVAETHKGAERRLLSSLGTCPGTTTYHKSWEHVPMISHVSVEVPSDWRTDSGHFRTQKMWSWPKSDFTCFHPRCYFSVSSTTIVKKSTQGGWRKTCCSLLSWCKLEPKIGLTMINIVLFIIIYYLHIPKSRLLDTWSASEPEMSSKNDPKWLASHYYWPPKNCLLHTFLD